MVKNQSHYLVFQPLVPKNQSHCLLYLLQVLNKLSHCSVRQQLVLKNLRQCLISQLNQKLQMNNLRVFSVNQSKLATISLLLSLKVCLILLHLNSKLKMNQPRTLFWDQLNLKEIHSYRIMVQLTVLLVIQDLKIQVLQFQTIPYYRDMFRSKI